MIELIGGPLDGAKTQPTATKRVCLRLHHSMKWAMYDQNPDGRTAKYVGTCDESEFEKVEPKEQT